MRAPPPFSPRRPFRASRRLPDSGTAAAVALVRVEFERERHRRELERLRRRAAGAVRALESLETRAAELCAVIAPPAGNGPAGERR